MNNNVNNILEKLNPIFTATDEILSSWTGIGHLQFAVLSGMVAIKLNWTEKEVKDNDPLLRFFVRNHPDYYVTRGAKGGIGRLSDKQKKDQSSIMKENIKASLQAEIEAKTSSSNINQDKESLF